MKKRVLIALLFVWLCALGAASMTACTCDPPPEEEDSDDDGGDDDVSDDDLDDDADDDGDDDLDDDLDDDGDDDADDDADPFAYDRLLYVPAPVEPGGEAVAVLTESWSDEAGSWFRVALVSPATAQIVRQGPAIGTGLYGYGSAWVEDFDGDGVAEIVAALLDADNDATGTRLAYVDPATLDVGTTIEDMPGHFGTLGPMIDIDRDDIPEIAVHLQDTATGLQHTRVYDPDGWVPEGAYWNSAVDAGSTLVNSEYRGLPRRGAWAAGFQNDNPPYETWADAPMVVDGHDVGGDYFFAPSDEPFALIATHDSLSWTAPLWFELREPGAYSAFFGPLESRDDSPLPDRNVLWAYESPTETRVEFYSQYPQYGSSPDRVFATYDAGTSIRLSASNDLDLDGWRDPAMFAVLPDDSVRLDLRLSAGNWTGGPSYTGDYDQIRLIGARTPPGTLTPGPIGGYDNAFGVLFDVTGEGGSSRIFWYGAPDLAAAGYTDFLQVADDYHLSTDARVHDYDGDGDGELIVITNGYDTGPLVRHHRVRVYDEDLELPAYDSGDTDGLAMINAAWDWDGDGAAETPITVTGGEDDPAVFRLYDNVDDWMTPAFEYTAEPGAIVTLLGLFR